MDSGVHEGNNQMPMQGDLGSFRELLLQGSPKMKLTPRRNGTRMDEIRPPEDEVKKVTRYRECLKNHAARIGGYALDGCGEFMAAGKEGTSDALKCATCDCHRNFHRREVEGESSCNCHHVCNEGKQTPGAVHNPPLALPATSATSNGVIDSVGHQGGISSSAAATKKRFRTKFSQEQKDKMLSFAEKLGWKIQKYDEGAVQLFCIGIGVKRHALKVWMHNNKNTLGKQIVPVPALHSAESNLD